MLSKANSLVAFIIFCQLKTAILEYEFDFDLVKWRQDLSDKSKVDGWGRKLNFP